MTKMVERVARALVEKLDKRFTPDFIWCQYREAAVAAITAMSEPTATMVGAVYTAVPELDCVRGHDLSGDEAVRVFSIMIAAALSEDK